MFCRLMLTVKKSNCPSNKYNLVKKKIAYYHPKKEAFFNLLRSKAKLKNLKMKYQSRTSEMLKPFNLSLIQVQKNATTITCQQINN